MPSAVALTKQQKQVLRFAKDDIRKALGEAFLLNDRVNQLLLENLDAGAWRAKPPGLASGAGVRTIAAIFSHMHNIRRKWLRLSAPHLKLPAELDRARCTQKQAAKALKESARLCAEMIEDKRVKQFVRDGWAKPWGLAVQADALRAKEKTGGAGLGRKVSETGGGSRAASGAVMMLAYMVSHEAHHRGQVCMLAHQMGYRLPTKVTAKMWDWGTGRPGHTRFAQEQKAGPSLPTHHAKD